MNTANERSAFVTVLASVFIAVSGFGALVIFLQNLVLHAFWRDGGHRELLQAIPVSAPPWFGWLMQYTHVRMLAILLLLVLLFVTSIALLCRIRWARWCFVGFMGLGILWNLSGLVLHFTVRAAIEQNLALAGVEGPLEISGFSLTLVLFAMTKTIGFSVLFAWIAGKLLSEPIAAEFRR